MPFIPPVPLSSYCEGKFLLESYKVSTHLLYVGFGSRCDPGCLVPAAAAAVRSGGKREEGGSGWSVCVSDHTLAGCSPLQQHSSTLSSHTAAEFTGNTVTLPPPHLPQQLLSHSWGKHVLRHAADVTGSSGCVCVCVWITTVEPANKTCAVHSFKTRSSKSQHHTQKTQDRYRRETLQWEKAGVISLPRTPGLSQEWQKCREWRFFFFCRGAAFQLKATTTERHNPWLF